MAGRIDLNASFEEMKEAYRKEMQDPEVLPYAHYVEGRGFISMRIDEYNRLWVEQLYGDMMYWRQVVVGFAQKANVSNVLFCTKKPKAYERLVGARYVGTVMEFDPWAVQLVQSEAGLGSVQVLSAERGRQKPSSKGHNKSSEPSTLRLVHSTQEA